MTMLTQRGAAVKNQALHNVCFICLGLGAGSVSGRLGRGPAFGPPATRTTRLAAPRGLRPGMLGDARTSVSGPQSEEKSRAKEEHRVLGVLGRDCGAQIHHQG